MKVEQTIPILRMFDVGKAKEFYVDYLGLAVDWEHRFEPQMPLYMQVSGYGMVLHLSEHHGDGVPGSAVFFRTKGLVEWHRELAAKAYPYFRPGIQEEPWGSLGMTLRDPFGNSLRFDEPMTGSKDE